MVLLWWGEEGEGEGPGPHGRVLLLVHDGDVVRTVVYQPNNTLLITNQMNMTVTIESILLIGVHFCIET